MAMFVSAEVESPNNRAYDHQMKREPYLSSGVPEYWIVNPNARASRVGEPVTSSPSY